MIDTYILRKTEDWSRPMVERLRAIYLSLGLIEELKWGLPTYSHHGLLCTIGAFKKHVGSWYFQGALLSDPSGVFENATEKTKAMRGLKFAEMSDIHEDVILQLAKEAMLLNELGIKVAHKKNRELVVPDYFMKELKKNGPALLYFEESSYSHKKEYVDWIVEAKKEETRARRMTKAIEMLSKGIHKNDQYR